MTPAQQAAYVEHQGELELIRDSDGLWLELHTAIVPTYYARGTTSDELWRGIRPARLARATVWALDAVDELEALCVHGSKHQWERLAWIVDVAMMARLVNGPGWRRLLAGARRHGTLRMVSLGLILAANVCDAPLPDSVLTVARRDRSARALARQVERELFEPRTRRFDGLIFHARMRERTPDRARYLLNVAFTPSGADWQAITLPGRLFGLYAISRPLRLAVKYGRRVLRGEGPGLDG